MSTEFFILAVLLLINTLLVAAMLLAARNLGQPRVALLWAGAFGCNVVTYILNALYFVFYHDRIAVFLLMSVVAICGPILASAGFRMRAGLPLRPRLAAASLMLALAIMLFFSFVDDNRGARGAVVPFLASLWLTLGVRAMWRRGRRLLPGERPMIATALGMAAAEFAGAILLALRGATPNAALENAYNLILSIALPALTVAAGTFILYLLASDLATRLRITAETDALTGAPNRRAIETTGARLIAEARAHRRPLTLAICDVDHFKDVNDRHGHGRGDEVLRELALLFRDRVNDHDHHGRYGGEEFVLFFPGVDLTTALALVEQLREGVIALGLAAGPATVTASFGVATLQPDDMSLSDLLLRADKALYASKTAGRNRTTPAPETAPAPVRTAARSLATPAE